MSITQSVRSVLGQYATFDGRARRSEYWWWTLVYSLVITVLYVLAIVLVGTDAASNPDSDSPGAGGIVGLLLIGLMFLLALATFLPSLAVTIRRLHDSGRSGWWYLISLIPFGGIVLIVFAVTDSTPGPNQYGPNPKGLGDAYGGQGYGAAPFGQQYAGQQFGTPQYGDQQLGTPQYGGQPYGTPPQADPRFGTPPQG